MHDTVAFVKMQALGIVFKLLAGNPEQEQNLLRLGVNKLVSSYLVDALVSRL
jgi:ribosome biogenesis protein MAK21